ncbi:MAG: hypothetical protein CMH81_04950 [Nitrospiraceae bacterium]|nr:hypothetical protein [Nitrospiraceae bacterium]|tara:strand:- start:369 stop:1019 length:651 start_codon:yes stop_codon:yes gene_type:complete
MEQFFIRRVFPLLGTALLRIYAKTLRIHTLYPERIDQFHKKRMPVIIAFWHGRQLMMPFAYRGKSGYVLVSQHRDGEYIHGILQRLGFGTVRGSTTRGGMRAVGELLSLAQAGSDLVFTPDGPRGPRCVAQSGIAYVAQKTGLPIVALAFGAAKKYVFQSWDRFQLPLPWTRSVFVWGEPLWVHRESGKIEREEKCKEIEDELNRVCDEADQYCLS